MLPGWPIHPINCFCMMSPALWLRMRSVSVSSRRLNGTYLTNRPMRAMHAALLTVIRYAPCTTQIPEMPPPPELCY